MDWLRVLAALGLLAAYACAAFGWGTVVCRVSRLRDVPWAVSAGVGVAAWIFLGGVLNLARLARPWALDAIVVVGWALGAWQLAARRGNGSARPRPSPGARVAAAIPWLAVLLVAAFVSLTLVPPRAYNIHDDLLTYLAHPVRMLATGTVFGSPVSAIGRIALGGQAFLHGFVLAHLPITHVAAVDTLFSVVLGMAMLVSFASRRGPAPVPALLAVLLFLAINPQAVNVTALYSGSALALAMLLLSTASPGSGDGWGRVRRLAPASLLGAALVALKPTFLPFAVLQLLLAAAAEALERRSLRALAASGATSLGLSLAFLAPWIVLHAPHYLAARTGDRRGAAGPTFSAIDPLDASALFYGDSVLHFTGAATLALAVGLALLVASGRSRPGEPSRAPALRLAAVNLGSAATYAALLVVPAVYGALPERIVRFSCAVLIAAAPTAVVLGWQELPPLLPARWSGPARAGLAGLALAVTASFAPGLVARVRQASEHGSILAFRSAATSEPYVRYAEEVASPGHRDRVAVLQALVPRGEPLLAWIGAPFQLDYSRNPIFDVDVAGLANPWATLPPVRHVLWSYRGFGIRSPAACRGMVGTRADELAGQRCAELQERLASLATGGGAEVIADDGETLLLRLHAPLSP